MNWILDFVKDVFLEKECKLTILIKTSDYLKIKNKEIDKDKISYTIKKKHTWTIKKKKQLKIVNYDWNRWI